MNVILTNDLPRWLKGCSHTEIQHTKLPRQLDPCDSSIANSQILSDPLLGPGVSAALSEYEYKRKQAVVVTVLNARLACVSLPMANAELEEHYYFVNERNEWLTENPYVAAFQYWFKNVTPIARKYGDYLASPAFPVRTEHVSVTNGSPAAFLGGRMNWTHWNIDCLPSLLLMEPRQDTVLVTSRLNAWQLDALNFFGLENHKRLQVSKGEGINLYHFQSLGFVWDFNQIDRMHFIRSKIDDRRSIYSKTPTLIACPNFIVPERIQRISNPAQLAEITGQFGAIPVSQSKLSYPEKLAFFSKIKTIVCLPGSESINPLIFGSASLQVIQMLPWPNELSVISAYSLLVIYRQLASQLKQNVNYLFSVPDDKSLINFEHPRYYSPVRLKAFLQRCLQAF